MPAKKKWKIAAAVIMTMLEALSVAALCYAVRDMRHEGLTYSQWYEASIYGFYGCLLITAAVTGLMIASWVFLLRKEKGNRANRKRVYGILTTVFFFLAAAFLILAAVRHGEIGRAAADNVECLEPYIRAYGNSLVCALLAFEAGIGFLLARRGAKNPSAEG